VFGIHSSSFNLHNVVKIESSLCAEGSILSKMLVDITGALTFNELPFVYVFQRICATAVNDT
jgi:hypothetical protein